MKTIAANHRRGIALVITLIMLSVVTLTAVAFLAVSRRERGAVSASNEQNDAHYLADAALNRAKAEVASGIYAASNRLAYGYLVSTNYSNPLFSALKAFNSYVDTRNFNDLTNVGYLKSSYPVAIPYNLGNAADRNLYQHMLANLYYSPRPPVFVTTNRTFGAAQDFRFYLDLNRNGLVESNGFYYPTDTLGRTNGFSPEWMYGDPEWIGVLEHPDAPHSGTNRFIGRFAYVVVPVGKTLDINYIHNSAKMTYSGSVRSGYEADGRSGVSAFMRNEGVGSWELNLAGFFSDLNTNVWPLRAPANGFQYVGSVSSPNTGLAFDDASSILRYRRVTTPAKLARIAEMIQRDSGVQDTLASTRYQANNVDDYSDGPIPRTLRDVRFGLADNDQSGESWPGSDYTNAITDFNQLFDPALDSSGLLARRLTATASNPDGISRVRSSYNNYTFYRLLSELGTDTPDGRYESGFHSAYVTPANPSGFYRRAKLHLNYAMQDASGNSLASASIVPTNGLRDWTALGWFTNAASRLLLTEFTNGLPFLVSDTSGTKVVPGLPVLGTVTNLFGGRVVNGKTVGGYLAPTNHTYSAQTHRLLQVAANIYDYANASVPTDPGLPVVFRPRLYRNSATPNLVRLGDYASIDKITEAALFANWISPSDPTLYSRLKVVRADESPTSTLNSTPAFNVYGIPWVVGVKKGLPAFHEAFWQSSMQVTRRLIATRPRPAVTIATSEAPFAGLNSKGFDTFAQYRLLLTNSVGVEAWNPYKNPYPRRVRIYATNYHQFSLKVGPTNAERFLYATNIAMGLAKQIVNPADWIRSPFQSPLNTARIYDFIYDPNVERVFPSTESLTHLARANQVMRPVSIYMTNSLVFAIMDDASGHLLDLVTLQSVVAETNVFRFLGTLVTNRLFGSTNLVAGDVWKTNTLGGMAAYGNEGIRNQFLVSLGAASLPDIEWINALAGIDNPLDKIKAQEGLRYFLYHTPFNTTSATSDRTRQTAIDQSVAYQMGYSPSATVYLTDRRMVNDPLVHYTMDDLGPGYSVYADSSQFSAIKVDGVLTLPRIGRNSQFASKVILNQIGQQVKTNDISAPWGTNANYGYAAVPSVNSANSTAFDLGFKDPGVQRADDWNFPQTTSTSRKFGNVGQLGRIHRGSPWQTLYLKSVVAPVGSVSNRLDGAKSWAAWSGHPGTHPTNDWKFYDLFTTALNDNAAKGLLGVNQTNIAAWSAVLSGVPVLNNTTNTLAPQLAFLEPNSFELRGIVNGFTNGNNRVSGIAQTITNNPGGYFPNMGSIFATPALSDGAPFLKLPTTAAAWKGQTNLTDEVIERLPQQVLSLLRADEPKVVVYSFAQTLKPAPNSIVTTPGSLFGLCTNYVVTGEYSTKSVLRFDGPPRDLNVIVEDHRPLTPGN
jgi:hypothetical protein